MSIINGVLFQKTSKSVNPRRFSCEVKTSNPLHLQQCDVVKAQHLSLYLQRKHELEVPFPTGHHCFTLRKSCFFCGKTIKNYPRLRNHICPLINFQTETAVMFMIQRFKHVFRAANEMRLQEANKEVYVLIIIIIIIIIIINMHTDSCGNIRRQKCCAKGSGKEVKMQEFIYI